MSKNHKNNHYHYAEKFSDRSRRGQNPSVMRMPRRAVFFAALVLLIFGVITFTFSTDEIAPEASENNDGSMIVTVRNAKVNRDLAMTGAEVDYAGTGGRFSGGDIFFVAPDDWDISNGVSILYDAGKNWTETYASNMDQIAASRIFHIAVSDLQGDYYESTNKKTINFKTGATWFCFFEGNDWGFGWGGYDRASYSANYTTQFTSYNVNQNYNVFTGTTKTGTTGNQNTYYQWNCSSNYYGSANDFKAVYSFDQTYKMQYKVGSGSYTDASSTVTPGSASLATSYWNTNDYKDGGTSTKSIAYNDYTYEHAIKTAPVTLSASAGDGFSLAGIYNSGGTRVDTTTAGTASYTVSGTATYYARFTANQYTITYNLTNGNGTDATAGNASWKTGYTPTTSRYYTQSVTLPTASNVEATGREFGGWYDNAACTGTAITSVPANRTSNITLYAKWTWNTFSVTYNKGDGSPVTGTIEGTVAAGTKTYNVDYTIKGSSDVYTRSGFTQAGWSSVGENQTSVEYDFGSTYSTNANLNLYPVWTLDAPTASLSGGTMVAGDANGINLNPQISAAPADVTQAAPDYHITGPSGNNATITASNGTAATASSAYFKTTTPGTYTVYVTVENTASTNVTNANSKASVDSDSVTINVQPIAPVFTFVINGIANPSAAGDANDPFKVLQGGYYDFTGTVTNPQSGYTYEWSLVSDFSTILGTGTTITFNDDDPRGVSGVTQNYEQSSAENAFDTNTITLYCRASCNSQINSGGFHSLSYCGEPLVEDFKFVPYQTIYQNNNSSVSLSAQYNMTNAQGYTTNLKFSPDNEFINNSVDAATITDEFMKVFVDPIKRYLYPDGPKYFYMNITASINNRQITSNSAVVHTTVGTLDSSAAKPLYFYNKTSTELSDYQVMCYWVDSAAETYGYQIAQDLYKTDSDHDGFVYRVNIPATATKAQFALVRKDENKEYHYYGTPTFENDTFTFSAPHYAGSTNLVTLTDSVRVIQTGASAATSTETVNGKNYTQYSFTCTPSAFVTN